jgi:hypothetical protein
MGRPKGSTKKPAPPPPAVDGSKPCKCGTGDYCHRHQQYALPETDAGIRVHKCRKVRDGWDGEA